MSEESTNYVQSNADIRGLYELVPTWKKRALQQRGLPGGRGLLVPLPPPLSCSKAWSRASSRSTILTAETNGVGFCRAKARALLTTAHSSLPEWISRQLDIISYSW